MRSCVYFCDIFASSLSFGAPDPGSYTDRQSFPLLTTARAFLFVPKRVQHLLVKCKAWNSTCIPFRVCLLEQAPRCHSFCVASLRRALLLCCRFQFRRTERLDKKQRQLVSWPAHPLFVLHAKAIQVYYGVPFPWILGLYRHPEEIPLHYVQH